MRCGNFRADNNDDTDRQTDCFIPCACARGNDCRAREYKFKLFNIEQISRDQMQSESTCGNAMQYKVLHRIVNDRLQLDFLSWVRSNVSI